MYTLDRGMKYGRDRSIPTLPVEIVDAVPIGPVGVALRWWVLGRQGGSRKEWRKTHAHRRFLVLVQLPNLQGNVVDCGVDARPPILRGRSYTLHVGNARLLSDGQVAKSALPFVVLLRDADLQPRFEVVEALGLLVEDEFGSGFMAPWRRW